MTAPAGDDFVWVGTVSGAWDNAANWDDLTTGANPAAAPPGTLDGVAFLSSTLQTITGTGAAASINFNSETDIAGTLNAGPRGRPSAAISRSRMAGKCRPPA